MPRAYLFVPGHRPDRFDKAWAAAGSGVIVDLEDAVAPQDKAAARKSVRVWLRPDRPVILRVNAAGSAWWDDDIALAGSPGVAAVMVAKAESAEALAEAAARAPAARLLPLVETARGIAQVDAVAQAPRVERLVFGSVDLQLDLGIEGEGDALLYFRSRLVLASRLAGLLPPVDGVCTALGEEAVLRDQALHARRLGFGAKLCIHPAQVPIVNASFAPSQAQLAWARRVVDAMTASAGAAVAVDGQMVDTPVWLKAQAMLRENGDPPGTHPHGPASIGHR